MASLDEQEKLARVSLLKLEHLYYKNDSIYERTKQALKGQPDKLAEIYFPDRPSVVIIEEMVQKILAHCQTRLKIKAVLL